MKRWSGVGSKVAPRESSRAAVVTHARALGIRERPEAREPARDLGALLAPVRRHEEAGALPGHRVLVPAARVVETVRVGPEVRRHGEEAVIAVGDAHDVLGQPGEQLEALVEDVPRAEQDVAREGDVPPLGGGGAEAIGEGLEGLLVHDAPLHLPRLGEATHLPREAVELGARGDDAQGRPRSQAFVALKRRTSRSWVFAEKATWLGSATPRVRATFA